MIIEERAGVLKFYGSPSAELFTLEIEESFAGILNQNFRYGPEDNLKSFVTASVDGRPWHDTMWSRDAGVFLRELVSWGYLKHACLLAGNLMRLVERNEEGYYTFPMYFSYGKPGHGSELDGTGAVIIGLISLWRRLDNSSEAKKEIERFLLSGSSPLRYIVNVLEEKPLVPGSGEFGGGMGVEGQFYNAVQNSLVWYVLSEAAAITSELGDDIFAGQLSETKDRLQSNIERYFIGKDGAWIWCIEPETLQPNATVLDYETNRGFAGINGICAMYADTQGFNPIGDGWKFLDVCRNTFDKLLSDPTSLEQYEKYGLYIEFQALFDGLHSSPAYGQGYAAQAALLCNRVAQASRLIGCLAEATVNIPAEYKLDRASRYHFYERMVSPDYFAGRSDRGFDQGCGALNLVSVSEPLKIARLIAGVDDSNQNALMLFPRLPAGWSGYKARNWPVLHGGKLAGMDLLLQSSDGGHLMTAQFTNMISRIEIHPNWFGEENSPIVFENVASFTATLP